MEREFQVKPSLPVGVFLLVYLIYTVVYTINNFATQTASVIFLVVACILFYTYFLGFRPYKYVVKNRTIYTYRRLLPKKELDLMQQSNITDPVVKLTKWTSTPHAIEIYDDRNKRSSFYPKDRVDFTGAVLRENKRIHCTVKDYTDLHRKLEKRQRKERKRAERRAAEAKREESK